jgi:hypothetical protein
MLVVEVDQVDVIQVHLLLIEKQGTVALAGAVMAAEHHLIRRVEP